jgi:hypothetical protein
MACVGGCEIGADDGFCGELNCLPFIPINLI